MYLPAHFEQTDAGVLHRLVETHPLGMLVTHGPNGLDANHLPFLHDASGAGPGGTLLAHVARKNPVWQEMRDGDDVLVVFRSIDAYVSPSFYPSKHETGRQVPTWNYAVVHAHGKVAVRDDERFVRGVVARLTRRHEAGEAAPWKMGDAPVDYIDEMLRQIVGIEIAVERLVGKFKLSQNKEQRDRDGVADALAARGHAAMSEAVRDA